MIIVEVSHRSGGFLCSRWRVLFTKFTMRYTPFHMMVCCNFCGCLSYDTWVYAQLKAYLCIQNPKEPWHCIAAWPQTKTSCFSQPGIYCYDHHTGLGTWVKYCSPNSVTLIVSFHLFNKGEESNVWSWSSKVYSVPSLWSNLNQRNYLSLPSHHCIRDIVQLSAGSLRILYPET
jgi:hypothetical protein